MNRRTIRIGFVDFWSDFNCHNNHFVKALESKYDLIIDNRSPEYLFVGTFGCRHLDYNCPKIYFTGENLVPDFNLFDYAIGFDFLDFGDRYLRLPLYLLRPNFKELSIIQTINDTEVLHRGFCSMVVSNMRLSSPIRKKFFDSLSSYRDIASGGRMWNNVGGPVADKSEFLRNYKFNIAFENSASVGYTTEKILDAFTSQTIPVYWGNPNIERDFNPEAFVCVRDDNDIDRAVEEIIHLDRDDDAYLSMLAKPKISNPKSFDWFEILVDFLTNIVEKPYEEARYTSDFGMQLMHRRHVHLVGKIAYDWKGDCLFSFVKQLKERLRL